MITKQDDHKLVNLKPFDLLLNVLEQMRICQANLKIDNSESSCCHVGVL